MSAHVRLHENPIDTDRLAAIGYAEHRVREAIRDFYETTGSAHAARMLLNCIVEEESRRREA